MTTVTTLAKVLPPDAVDDALQLLDERGADKLALFVDEIESITHSATAAPIQNRADEGKAAELISRGGIALKELDELRRRHTDPLNEQVKATNALFKRLTDPLQALVGKGGRLERLVLAFRAQERARLERERQEAERKQREAAEREAAALAKAEAAKTARAREKALAEAAAAATAQAEATLAVPMEMTRGVRTDSGSVTERERWVFTVQDAAQVPRQFLCVDEKAIRAAIGAGTRQIPGVAIYIEESLTRRTG